jgi:glycosyltransferase involved in cell wall biosynthesis
VALKNIRKLKQENLTITKKINSSIICCLYNEVDIIDSNLVKFIKKIKDSKLNLEIIVVDNNSNDGTKKKLKKLKEKKLFKNITYIFNNTNLGKGGSIKKACKIAKGKYCCVFDIDEYFVKDLLDGIKLVNVKNFDFLVGSRVHEKNKYIYKGNYYGVRFLTFLINFFFNTKLTDSAGAIKIFNKNKFKKVDIKTSGFDFEFELICKFAKKKFKIAEFYNTYKPRTYAEGKKLRAWKDGSKILRVILKSIL